MMIKIKKNIIHQAVADSLNKKGILPFSAREWNVQNVQQVVYLGIIATWIFYLIVDLLR